MTEIKVDGLSEIRETLKQFGVNIDEAIERALKSSAEEVIQLSTAKVPVQTGYLRDSVYFKIDGDTVEVGYKADYAVDIHERTERGHSSGQSKFLEQALNEFAPQFIEVFAKYLAKEINNA